MLKPSELRELNPDELREKESELSQQLFTLRLQKVTQGQLDNPAKVTEVRRDIARVLTILREQERAQAEA